jgi:predicted DCC family thiol-disulfide oxidoreductase YuxK
MVQYPETASQRDAAQRCDTLYYDGQCPLCADEIEALRKRRGDALRLVDIHEEGPLTAGEATTDDATGAPTPNRDELLRTLHLQRADGRWLRGADANVAAWEGTRRGRLLSVLRWPLLRHVVDLGYALWARWRYRRLYGRQYREEAHAPRS